MEQEWIQNTLSHLIYGGQQQLEKHLRLKEIVELTPALHKQPEYYTLDVEDKMKYEIKQTIEVIKLVKKGIVKIEDLHLLYDLVPEGVAPLENHTSVFLPYLKYIIMKNNKMPQQQPAIKLASQFIQLSLIGCVLMQEIHTENHFRTNHIKDITTELVFDKKSSSYVLNTQEKIVKYCPDFSYIANYAIVLTKYTKDDKKTIVVPVLVQLRDQNLQIKQGVTIKYFGKSVIENQKFGIAFNNYTIPQEQLISTIHQDKQEYISLFNFLLKGEISQLQHSCKDLLKAVYLGVKYASMRTQFKDTKESQQEKHIINYQVVHQRITNALSVGLIYQTVINKQFESYMALRDDIIITSIVFFKGLKSRLEEKILEQIEIVRECCGGFGFQRFSGFPCLYERVINRITTNDDYKKDIIEVSLTYLGKQKIQFLDEEYSISDIDIEKFRVHYFNFAMNEQALKKRISQYPNLNEKQINDDLTIFKLVQCSIMQKKIQCEKLFLEADRNVNKTQVQLLDLGYELIDAFCIVKFQAIHFYKFFRFASKALNLVFVRFYIEKLFNNFSIVNEFSSNLSRQQQYDLVMKKKNDYEQQIKELYPTYLNSFQIDNTFKCVIIGRDNSDEFYIQLQDWSKNRNNRNNPQAVSQIHAELLPLLNAKPNL